MPIGIICCPAAAQVAAAYMESEESREKRFRECQKKAAEIVASYRAEAPEGCDPQNTWVAIAGTVIVAGTAAYGASQQKKAGEQASSAKVQTIDPILLDDPETVDPMAVLQGMYGINQATKGGAKRQMNKVNRLNYREQLKYLERMQPNFSNLQAQTGQNALSMARGELPQDVIGQITRMSAQQGIQGGFGFGSQGARSGAMGNNILRNLGLNSLDVMKYGTNLGMQVNSQAKSLLPNMSGIQDWLLNPNQAFGIAQNNAQVQNQFALQNNQTQNAALGANTAAQNAQAQNAAQAQAASTAAQGQTVAAAGSSIAGIWGGMAGGLGTGQQQNPYGATYAAPTRSYSSYPTVGRLA